MILISLIFLAIALSPTNINFSGRVVAAYGLVNIIAYLMFAFDIGGTSQYGIVGLQSDASANIFSGYGLTALLLLGLALFMAFNNRTAVMRLEKDPAVVKIPENLSWAIIVYTTVIGIVMVYSIGPSTLLSYEGYGKIKDASDLYGSNSILKNLLGTFRLAAIFTILLAVFNFHRGRRHITFGAAIPISIALIIGIASASRIVALYFAAAAISLYITRQRTLAAVSVLCVVLSLAYAVEGRSYDKQGLSHTSEYMAAALVNPDLSETLLKSVSGTIQLTSASINSAVPSAYATKYKLLSFAPTISVIDKFQNVKEQNEQRIWTYIPFNSFGEAWAFGFPYFTFLWIVIFFTGYCVNSSAKFGRFQHAILMGAFVIGLVYASQYPVRNAARYFYILIAMRFAMGYLHRRLIRRRLALVALEAARRRRSLRSVAGAPAVGSRSASRR